MQNCYLVQRDPKSTFLRDHSAPRLSEQIKPELFIALGLNAKFGLTPEVRNSF